MVNKMIMQKIQNHVKNTPDHPALWVNGMFYSYKNFFNSAYSLSKLFQNITKKNTRCAFLTEKNITAYRILIAALFAGKAYMPLNILFPQERNIRLLKEGAPELICIDVNNPNLAIKLLSAINSTSVVFFNLTLFKRVTKEITKHRYYLWESSDEYSNLLAKETLYVPKLEDDAYLLFTSGSTGQPKGIAIKHRHLLHFIDAMSELCQLTMYDKCTQLSELTFDLSVHDMLICWTNGATLYSLSPKHMIHLKEFMQTHQLTVWLSVPSTITLLTQLGVLKNNSFPSIKKSLFCGETLFSSLCEKWRSAAPHSEIINLYGPTEATIAVTFHKWKNNDHTSSNIPIGKPFKNLFCALINEDGSQCDEGIGELCLAGPQVVEEYWKNEIKTQQQFKKFAWDKSDTLWYCTGDLAKWHTKVGYEFIGRKDDQWQIRGNRIEKFEIENEVRKITGQINLAVVPLKSKEGHIYGTILFIGGIENKTDNLRKKLRAALPDIMIPEEIIYLSNLPRNANGKIDYNYLCQIINERGYIL